MDAFMINDSELRVSDLQIEQFDLWVHGRQFPESENSWDANWLDVTAKYEKTSSIVWTSGPIIHLSELKHWLTECKQIYSSLSGKASLQCMEPYLAIDLKMKKTGRLDFKISITPDYLHENHIFEYELDQSYLPPLIKNLEDLLEKFPLKGADSD